MRLLVASGKGGAGKTTVAACLLTQWGRPCLAADADVEAPNLHLYLKPELAAPEPVFMEVPQAVPDRCTACGACRELCRFGAVALLGSKATFFAEMCHGCGGCFAVCPAQAVSRSRRELGVLLQGVAPLVAAGAVFLMGRSRVGEAMTPPLLRALSARLDSLLPSAGQAAPDAIVDGPPGVSCPTITIARKADAVLLVAEPTPFGIHDFRLARAALEPLGVPTAVALNRVGMAGNDAGEAELRRWCREQRLPILAELPFDGEAAAAGARGLPPTLAPQATGERWREISARLARRVQTFAAEARHA